jgi:hypothetical protein
VKHETHVVAGERQDPRGFFYGHDSERLDHPGIANDAMTDGADACKAATEIASNRGRSHSRWIHHQLPARCQSRLERFENNRPALHANVTRFHRYNFIEAGHIEEHTTFEGHRLPIVARTTAPNGQWNSMLDGCRHHGGDFLLALRLNHNFRHAILKLGGKHRAVPVKVVGFLANFTLINRRADSANVVAKLLDEHLTCHLVL